MSLVPVKEYATAEEMMAAYRARQRPKPVVIPMDRVRVVEPDPVVEPELVDDDATPVAAPEKPEVVELPNFLPLRRADLDKNPGFRRTEGKIVLDTVSRVTGVSVLDLKSERRTAKVVLPRHIACWAMRELTTMSLPRIGQHLGGRDHTSILFGINKIERLRQTDQGVRQLSDDIAAAARREML